VVLLPLQQGYSRVIAGTGEQFRAVIRRPGQGASLVWYGLGSWISQGGVGVRLGGMGVRLGSGLGAGGEGGLGLGLRG
jgi:hypothetical protein